MTTWKAKLLRSINARSLDPHTWAVFTHREGLPFWTRLQPEHFLKASNPPLSPLLVFFPSWPG